LLDSAASACSGAIIPIPVIAAHAAVTMTRVLRGACARLISLINMFIPSNEYLLSCTRQALFTALDPGLRRDDD
jgi:hypothetical protein